MTAIPKEQFSKELKVLADGIGLGMPDLTTPWDPSGWIGDYKYLSLELYLQENHPQLRYDWLAAENGHVKDYAALRTWLLNIAPEVLAMYDLEKAAN
jgi:hypothetical protein